MLLSLLEPKEAATLLETFRYIIVLFPLFSLPPGTWKRMSAL